MPELLTSHGGVCGSQKVEEHSVPGKNLHEALKRMKSNMLMCQESMAEKMVVSDEETTEKKNHDEETGDADSPRKAYRQLGDDEAMALDETCIIALEYRLPIHRLAMLLSDSQNNKGKDAALNNDSRSGMEDVRVGMSQIKLQTEAKAQYAGDLSVERRGSVIAEAVTSFVSQKMVKGTSHPSYVIYA
ncbi:hypothetical protein Tco_0005372 [Tanacetum coccineum]